MEDAQRRSKEKSRVDENGRRASGWVSGRASSLRPNADSRQSFSTSEAAKKHKSLFRKTNGHSALDLLQAQTWKPLFGKSALAPWGSFPSQPAPSAEQAGVLDGELLSYMAAVVSDARALSAAPPRSSTYLCDQGTHASDACTQTCVARASDAPTQSARSVESCRPGVTDAILLASNSPPPLEHLPSASSDSDSDSGPTLALERTRSFQAAPLRRRSSALLSGVSRRQSRSSMSGDEDWGPAGLSLSRRASAQLGSESSVGSLGGSPTRLSGLGAVASGSGGLETRPSPAPPSAGLVSGASSPERLSSLATRRGSVRPAQGRSAEAGGQPIRSSEGLGSEEGLSSTGQGRRAGSKATTGAPGTLGGRPSLLSSQLSSQLSSPNASASSQLPRASMHSRMAPSAAPTAALASALPSVAEVRAGAGARAAAGRWRRLTESRSVRDALQALVRASALGGYRQELCWVHGMRAGRAWEERPQEDEGARLLRPLWKYKVPGDGVVQCMAFSEADPSLLAVASEQPDDAGAMLAVYSTRRPEWALWSAPLSLPATSLLFLPSGHLCVGFLDGGLALFDPASRHRCPAARCNLQNRHHEAITGLVSLQSAITSQIPSLEGSASHSLILSSSSDGALRAWSGGLDGTSLVSDEVCTLPLPPLPNPTPLRSTLERPCALLAPRAACQCLARAPGVGWLAAGTCGGQVVLLSLAEWVEPDSGGCGAGQGRDGCSVDGPGQPQSAETDGSLAATSCLPGGTDVRMVASFHAHEGGVRSLSWASWPRASTAGTRDGSAAELQSRRSLILLSIGADETARIWRLNRRSLELLAAIPGVTAGSWHPESPVGLALTAPSGEVCFVPVPDLDSLLQTKKKANQSLHGDKSPTGQGFPGATQDTPPLLLAPSESAAASTAASDQTSQERHAQEQFRASLAHVPTLHMPVEPPVWGLKGLTLAHAASARQSGGRVTIAVANAPGGVGLYIA